MWLGIQSPRLLGLDLYAHLRLHKATDYLLGNTGRRSYQIGPTVRRQLETRIGTVYFGQNSIGSNRSVLSLNIFGKLRE